MSSHTSPSPKAAPTAPPSVPLVVQVGFAGARRLWPRDADVDPQAFEHALALRLRAVLQALPSELGLTSQHFIVAISQVAAGADLMFSQTIAELGWGQRVFLPQLREDYLSAQGSQGADFTDAEKARVRTLLASPHIIEERVVTTAADREARFDETNLQILAESDVLVCLRRDGQVGLPGGTQQLIKRAVARGAKVLELCVSMTAEGTPALAASWNHGSFTTPSLPTALQSEELSLRLDTNEWPPVTSYAKALKERASERAGRRRTGFEMASMIVIGTHVVATLLATLAMDILHKPAVYWVLAVELMLLGWGCYRHWKLHHDKHTEDWALARLSAELARSVLASHRLSTSLSHLLVMPLPSDMQAVLRTLNVLQLREARHAASPDWEADVSSYANTRLGSASVDRKPGSGQLGYYTTKQAGAKRLASIANATFLSLSMLAILATTAKIALKATSFMDELIPWAGLFAVVSPVVAVGAMSFAAALDAEAREHTFHQLATFAKSSKDRLLNVTNKREASALVAEVESRLLGETALWYSRRAYTSVA